MAAALVLAVMTGPPGTNAAPTSGFTGSLRFPRVFVVPRVRGVVMFAVVSIWQLVGRDGARAGEPPPLVDLHG